MSRSAGRNHRRRTRPAHPRWRTMRLTVILSFLCLAIIAVGFALAENAQGAFGQGLPTSNTCHPTLSTTGNPAQSAKWFSIRSGSAADILSAVKCTDMFQSALQGNDLIAYALRTGTLANPVLVKPYRSDAGLAQYWVVPVVGKNNYPLALLTFFYDPQSHLIQEGEFDAVTNDMFYVNHPFPAVTLNRAVAAVATEEHVSAVRGLASELIYFPGDVAGLEAGRQNWHAGGTAVIDPIWRVPGVDSKWHYVDHDGHAHLSTDLPVDPAYPPVASATTTQ